MSRAPGRLRAGGLGVVLALVATSAACVDSDGPHIDAVSPTSAARGAQVELTGERFCGPGVDDDDCAGRAAGHVAFGLNAPTVRATIVAWASTRIVVTVPSAAPTGATDLIVTVDGRSSNAVAFEVQ